MPTDEEPLPSSTALELSSTDEADLEAEQEAATEADPTPKRPAAPAFKISTFIYVFLGMLGLLMIIDTAARNSVACLLGTYTVLSPLGPTTCATGGGPLYFVIGFQSHYLLLTMAIAGAIEMLITAVAYNYTTDWIKAAKVQKWSAAFRKVQMEAIRSGKKDRIAALKPHQERLTRLSSEVSIAQFKGMAITWFLLILIYTWVGLLIAAASPVAQTVSLGGTVVNLYLYRVAGYFPLWFFIFSLYTIPFSLVFRRVLKNYWLRRHLDGKPTPPTPPAVGAAGGSA
ncbi:MAG: EMC3/TMCO1 family protein [Thermoplasmata archaeon]|nr:EMC3/TMCO1 family protein [Thermoplasmata archaeon]